MIKNFDIISTQIVIILILFSLTTIFGCDGDDWSFDLFGGDTVNGDNGDGDGDGNGNGDGDGDGNGNNGNGDSVEFPAAVFSASIGGNKTNEPIELFSSFDNGSEIKELTGVISQGGEVDEFENVFKVSPDGTLVAYLTDQENSQIELFVVPVKGGTKTQISELESDDADVTEFDWSPDSDDSRIAYLVESNIDGRVELYTNLAKGDDNLKVSGDGTVKAYEWSPDGLLLAYTADPDNFEEFELFTTPPTEQEPVKVSETFSPNRGDVTEFSWSSDSSRIAYLSDQRSADRFELFTSLPRDDKVSDRISEGVNVKDFAWAPDDIVRSLAYSTVREIYTARPNGDNNKQITPGLTAGGEISDFSWAPDSSRIGYRADQETDEVFELFTVEPDGDDDFRISGDLTTGGDVTDFVWSPDSDFVAYRANQDDVIKFELYVTTPDDSSNDTKVSGTPMIGDVDPIFEWSPDSERVAYRANQITADAIELFTSTPDGDENDRVSGDLASDGNVGEFIWAPRDNSGDSPGIGYIADQENDEVYELFGTTPDGDEMVTLSGSFAEDDDGDVLFFEWVP